MQLLYMDIAKKKLYLLNSTFISIKLYFSSLSNAREIKIFTKNFTNCWYDKWLLVNERMMLMVGINENQ